MTTTEKRCILIHGCAESEADAINPETGAVWIDWIKGQLEARGVKAEVPIMPECWNPVYEKFKQAFEECEVDEQTILVGHSCACAFLVRWLGESQQKIAKFILVAPWKIAEWSDPVRQAFYTSPIDPTIASRVGEIVMFTSDNEEPNGKKSLQLFHEALGGRIIDLPNHGHYIADAMGTNAFPKLLEEILK